MTARDFDFDTITLDSGSVVVTVIDDIPINQSQTSSTGTVEEEHLEQLRDGDGLWLDRQRGRDCDAGP